jgi:hypothetical protein
MTRLMSLTCVLLGSLALAAEVGAPAPAFTARHSPLADPSTLCRRRRR